MSGPSLEGTSGRPTIGGSPVPRAAGGTGGRERPRWPAGGWWAEPLCSAAPHTAAPADAARRRSDTTFELSACEDAPGLARRLSRGVLADWGLAQFADPMELVLSELVTNAVRHGMSQNTIDCRYGTVIRVRLLRRGTEVVCAVHDPGDHLPVARRPDFLLESGRGLHLVECFSRGWGVVPTLPHGKYVWALFG